MPLAEGFRGRRLGGAGIPADPGGDRRNLHGRRGQRLHRLRRQRRVEWLSNRRTRESTTTAGGGDGDDSQPPRACVWEIYHRKDGTVYVVCDGYPDFLQEPSPPDAETTRFCPWFAFVLNEGYDEKRLYPQSDIDLVRDMQLELNRARQGLREHRRANRPKTAVAAGILEEADLDKLRTHPANALLELNALAPGQKIDDVLQVIKMPPIDAAVYDTAAGVRGRAACPGLRPGRPGDHVGDATATEVSVAQFSQNTDLHLDGGRHQRHDDGAGAARRRSSWCSTCRPRRSSRVVGPGAVWPAAGPPDGCRQRLAGGGRRRQRSPEPPAGRPDTRPTGPPPAACPRHQPEWLARQLIRRMGDDIDLTRRSPRGSRPSRRSTSFKDARQCRPRVARAPPGDRLVAAPGPEPPGGAGKGPPRPGPIAQNPAAQGPAGAGHRSRNRPPGWGRRCTRRRCRSTAATATARAPVARPMPPSRGCPVSHAVTVMLLDSTDPCSDAFCCVSEL